jgi:hypothetical protein
MELPVTGPKRHLGNPRRSIYDRELPTLIPQQAVVAESYHVLSIASHSHPHIHQQHTANMSFESDLIQYPSTKSTDAQRPELFFAPPPQHTDAPSPESFDREVAELDLNFPFEPFGPFDDFLPTFTPIISTPSALTYSTDSVHEVTSSHYSSDFSQSDYSIPSEIGSYYSLNNGLYRTHDSIHSAFSSNGPPDVPPLHPAEVQFDFGTSDLSPNVGISPEDLSTAMQPPTSVVPTLPVHVTPASEAQMAPASDRPYKCPLCPHCKAETI